MLQPFRLLHSDGDYQDALARLDEVFDAAPGTPESQEREFLAVLIDRYENERTPIGPATPAEAIRFLMGQRGLRERELDDVLGGSGKARDVLEGRRRLTLSMIKRLSLHFAVSADLFIERGLPVAPPRRRAS